MNVVRYQPDEDQPQWIAMMAPAVELAKAIAGTDFVPQTYRGKPAEVTAAIMFGAEVGLGPLQSLAKIAVIKGRPTLAAEAQRALILAAGHEFWVEEATTTRVTVGGRRRDSDRSQLFTWTLDDAKRAGLAGQQNWRTYPRQMLLARATAELARAVFPDVIGGLMATEEAENLGDEDAPVAPIAAEPEPPAAGTTRRRRPARRTTPVIAPTPPPADEPEGPPLPNELDEAPKPTAAQLRNLFALFHKADMDDDQARTWCNEHLDRTITSRSELTADETSRLIDQLEKEIDAVETFRGAHDQPPQPEPGE